MRAPITTIVKNPDAAPIPDTEGEPFVLDVPSVVDHVDADGVEWRRLSPEDYWGPQRNWARKLDRYRRQRARET